MSVALFPTKTSRKSSMKKCRLTEIATILGVSEDVFRKPANPYVIYTGDDGTCWLLDLDDQGAPTVRMDSPAAGQNNAEENVSAFLARDLGSPQHQALIELIDHLLVIHLAR